MKHEISVFGYNDNGSADTDLGPCVHLMIRGNAAEGGSITFPPGKAGKLCALIMEAAVLAAGGYAPENLEEVGSIKWKSESA